MGLVRIVSNAKTPADPGPEAEQITATVSFRIDTRFNEYISKADPAERRLLRALRAEVLQDIAWLTNRCAGMELPLVRHFTGTSDPTNPGTGQPA